ncbi:MAG: dehydratase [Parcubacteria group bacterium GW2011_GWA2_47_7]|nr:MAG: dehydratase [Parcubacteria group bacterium GW2011_GWA2_47_7]
MSDKVKQYTYNELVAGQSASFVVRITDELVSNFVQLSGDANPLHTDSVYAAETDFGKPVAHGMIAGAFFSRLVGMELPGKYCVYLSQSITFHQPMFAGMEVLVSGLIVHKSDAVRTVTIETKVQNNKTKELLSSGQALVRLLQ